MVSGLTKLERLKISRCPVLTSLVHVENSGDGGVGTITFQELKFLCLQWLPKLLSLCDNDNVVELPQLLELRLDCLPTFTSIYSENKTTEMQPFLNKEVVIPKLEYLFIYGMEKLKQIWPYQITSNEEFKISMLKEIEVWECENLVNVFPTNPLPLLSHLEKVKFIRCASIEVLFHVDLGCVVEVEEDVSSSWSRLRRIEVSQLKKLTEVWTIKGANNSPLVTSVVITTFSAVESIEISWCERFRNIFAPGTINFDLGALKDFRIYHCGESWINKVSMEEKINVISMEETSKVGDHVSNVAFPSYPIHAFYNLCRLDLLDHQGLEVVFEIETPSSRRLVATQDTQTPLILPNLEELRLYDMESMTHVWKFNWNRFLVLEKHQPKSTFHNLTTINIYRCNGIKYLFSPLMAKLLVNLKEVEIHGCGDFEEVVSSRDDEYEEMTAYTSTVRSTNLFPNLHFLNLNDLGNLKCIGGGGTKGERAEVSFNNTSIMDFNDDQFKFSQGGVISWSLCQYCREIRIEHCNALASAIPSYALGKMQKVEVLRIRFYNSLMEVFEIHRINNGGSDSSRNVDEGSFGTDTTQANLRNENIMMLKLPNLRILEIEYCDLLEHIFTFSTLESLRQLEELTIKSCKSIKVIVKEDNGEQTIASKQVVAFPRLKSIALVNLPNLAGFFLGRNRFQWPLLDKLMIGNCPQMMEFTSGQSTASKLKYIHSSLGKHSLECGVNFHVPITLNQVLQTPFPSLDTTFHGVPWYFHKFIEVEVEDNHDVKMIIPFNELLLLQKLEKIHIKSCSQLEEVFEALEGTNRGFNESQTVVKFPNLREADLKWLANLKYIWKSNRWMVLELPNLTRVSVLGCDRLQHVFTCSMVGSLLQLQDLHIINCENIEVIVKEEEEEEEEECEDKMIEFKLPCLKSLILEGLGCLKGFYLGKEGFSCSSLDTLEIKGSPEITTFTKGRSTVQEQTIVETDFGSFYARKDINSFIKTKLQEGFEFQVTDGVHF